MLVFRMVHNIQRLTFKKGGALSRRHTRWTAFSLTFEGQAQHDIVREKAKGIIKDYLEHQAMWIELEKKSEYAVRLVKIIQDRWKAIRFNRLIKQAIVARIWDEEIAAIEQYCIKYKTKNKKIKHLYKSIL